MFVWIIKSKAMKHLLLMMIVCLSAVLPCCCRWLGLHAVVLDVV